MKTNLSNLERQFLVSLMLLSVVLLGDGCNSSTNRGRGESSDTTILVLQNDTPPQINNARQLIDSLLNLSDRTVQALDYDEAVPQSHVEPLASSFLYYYGNNVNPNISNIDFNIKWVALSSEIQLNKYKAFSDTFVAFYYLLNTDNENDKYYTYVISKAMRKNINGRDTIIPISTNSDGKYVMLSKTTATNYELISASKFDVLIKAYIGQVQFRSKTENSIYPVRNYIHPLISYHEASSFYQFYNENKDSVSDDSMLMLKIKNIINDPEFDIVNRSNGSAKNDFCQAPLSYFYEGGKIFLSDKPNGGKKYLFRAMNVGRLCPPDC